MAIMSSGYSARSIPFHGLPSSKIVKDAPTAHDAMIQAGLDWNVILQSSYQQIDLGNEYSYRPVPNSYLTVREDTQKVLGTVGAVYSPFQARDAFSFADELLGFGATFDAAGSYDNDRKFFLTAQLPNGITIPNPNSDENDNIDLYLLFRSSHDGSAAIQAMITPIRLACTNMMNLALKSARQKWSCRHTSTASDRIQEALRTLQLVNTYTQEFEHVAALLQATEVNLDGFTRLIEETTPSPRLRTGMLETWSHSPTVDRRTGWGAINAIGEFMEHERTGKGGIESRFDSNIDGQTSRTRDRALQLLVRR